MSRACWIKSSSAAEPPATPKYITKATAAVLQTGIAQASQSGFKHSDFPAVHFLQHSASLFKDEKQANTIPKNILVQQAVITALQKEN